MISITKITCSLAAAAAFLAFIPHSLASNTIYKWDASGTSPSAPTDGTGTWDGTTANWVTGGADVAFGNSSTSQANIGANNGAAGTITVSGTITVNTVNFVTPGSGNYTLNGGTLNMAGSSPAPKITAGNSSLSPTINSVIGEASAGTAVIFGENSGGTFTVGGNNTFSGTATLGNHIVNFNLLANGGSPSSFGQGASTVPVVVCDDFRSATANYTGTGGGTDRPWNINGSGGGVINNNGSGAISFNNAGILVPASGSVGQGANHTLTLGGSYTASANTFAEIINDPGTATTTTAQLQNAGDTSITLVTNASFSINNNIAVGSQVSGTGIAAGTTVTAVNTTTEVVTLSQAVVSPGVTSGETITFSAATSVKVSGGTWKLTATNTYSGATTISAGTLTIGSAGQLGAGVYAGLITNNGALNDTSSSNQTLSGIISGTGTLTNSGTGTLTLSATNTFSGGTTISSGTVVLGVPGALGAGAVTLNGGILNLSTNSLTNTIVLNNSLNTISANGNYRALGPLTGAGGFILSGINSPGITINNTSNNFQGNITINSGAFLRADTSDVIPHSAIITNNGGLRLSENGSETIAGLVGGTGGSIIIVSSVTNTLVVSNNISCTFGGSIIAASQTQKSLNLIKTGSSIFTITGTNNTYTGSTTVSNGTLLVNGSITPTNGSASFSAVSVLSGATFGGTGTNSGTVSFNSGSHAVFTVTASGGTSGSNTTPFAFGNSLTIAASGTIPDVHLNLPNGLVAGTYTLASYTASGSSGAFNATPVIDSGSFAMNATANIITSSGSVLLVVSSSTTSATALFSSGSPSVYGQSVTFTASVQTNGVIAGNATGNYVFKVDGTLVATSPVSGGLATYSTATLAAGTHTISAEYSGDSNYTASTNTFSQSVNKATPVLTLAATGITYGQTLASSSVGASTATNANNNGGVTGSFAFANSNIAPNAGTTNVTVNFTPTDTANYNGTSGTVAVNVARQAPTVLLASSQNPAGFKDNIYFTVALPADASGSAIFQTNNASFSTNSLAGGSAVSAGISTLPRGTNIITAIYSGDANYLAGTNSVSVAVTNHPPLAGVMTVTRTAGLGLHIALSDLATNWSDADGDTLILNDINLVTTNGVNLSTNSGWIFYTNSPNVNDQISYSISDGFGGTNAGVINIVIQYTITGTNSIAGITTGVSNIVTAYGIPGYNYVLERATDLPPSAWVDISTNAAAANGQVNAADTFWDLGGTPPASAFYRLKWQP